jgi:L-alanine-DL-glutamate epimerase-like enolase superfamily enzyme
MAHHSLFVIVRIVTDSGLIGYGEACPVAAFTGETPESIAALIDSRVRECIVGKDPREILPIVRSLERVLQRCPFTLCAVDIALWDLMGKFYDLPISTLLGGAFRSAVEVHGSVGWTDDPAVMAESALAQLRLGFRSLKLYVGCGDLASDLARLRHVRATVGEGVNFLLDVNQQWDARTALAALPELHSLGVILLEQPLPAHDSGGQAELVRWRPP